MDERGVMDEHRYIKAAELLDPTKTLPCLCFDGYGAFCGQALRWPRHPRDHDFVGLASLLRIVVAEERARVRREEVGPLVEAVDAMLQAFDPNHPGACPGLDCCDEYHGHDLQEAAKHGAWEALALHKQRKTSVQA